MFNIPFALVTRAHSSTDSSPEGLNDFGKVRECVWAGECVGGLGRVWVDWRERVWVDWVEYGWAGEGVGGLNRVWVGWGERVWAREGVGGLGRVWVGWGERVWVAGERGCG